MYAISLDYILKFSCDANYIFVENITRKKINDQNITLMTVKKKYRSYRLGRKEYMLNIA